VEDIIVFRSTNGDTQVEEKPAEEPKVEVQTSEGDAWEDVASGDSKTNAYTTLSEYLERNKENHENRVFYASDASIQATYIELYKNQGVEVLYMDSFIDNNYFVPFLEREHSEVKFSRVDSELDQTLLEDNKADEIVDPTTNKSRSDLIKEIFEQALNKPKVNIKTQALKSEDDNTPPAMVLLPEAMRRLREMTALMQQQEMEFPDEHILVINTAHPLIENILNLSKGGIIQGSGESPTNEMVKLMCNHIYDLALVTQKGFSVDEMKNFVGRSNQLLTRLSK
jgi:molecular chaperone HtpG